MTLVHQAFIGLGSNLDDPVQQIRSALSSLASAVESTVERQSKLYRNPPMGPTDQPDFVNAVAEIETTLSARSLLENMQAIETAHGRVRGTERWGPRTLDLDLLLFDDEEIDQPGLQIPHPGLTQRPFVLIPLLEIAPHAALPNGAKLKAYAAGMDCSAVVPIS